MIIIFQMDRCEMMRQRSLSVKSSQALSASQNALKKSKRAPFAIFCSIGKLAEEGLVQSERGVAFQLLEISLGECRLGGEGHRALLQRNCVEAVEGCLKWGGRATCGGGTCVEEEVLQMSPEQEGKTFHCRGA